MSDAEATVPRRRSIPWGLLFSVTFIGGVVGWFYRSSKSQSRLRAFTAKQRATLVVAPDEIVMLREANKLTVNLYRELAARARAVPARMSATDFFCHFVPDQLGGEYQAKQSLRQGHVLQRLAAALDAKPQPPSLNVLLVGLALAVRADPPQELLCALFDQLSPQESMTPERFAEALDMFVATDQLPVRVLVREIDQYPLRDYVRATPTELAAKAGDKPVTRARFVELMTSPELCVWGTCSAQRAGRL